MKKKISALFLASALMVTANAAALPELDINSTIDTSYEDRQPMYTYAYSIIPTLSVSGTQANYNLLVRGISSVTKISATMQLQKKNSSGTYANYGSSWGANAFNCYRRAFCV